MISDMQKTSKELIEALQWRYAVKRFDSDKKIPEADLQALLEATRLSASSYGLQPYRFVLVNDPELRNRLKAASWNQAQITEASHMLVFAAKTDLSEADTEAYMQLISATRGVPREALQGFADAINGKINAVSEGDRTTWAAHQAYIAVGNLLAAAAQLRIDACPMEGFSPEQYDEILELDQLGLTAKVVVTLGYRSSEDGMANAPKVRMPAEQLFIQK